VEKKAASVLLKRFVNGNKQCHSTNAPQHMSETIFSNVKKHTIYEPRGPEKYNYTIVTRRSLVTD